MNAEVTSTSTELTVAQRAQVALQTAENERKLRELAEASKSIREITNSAGYQQCHASRMALKRMRLEIEQTGELARKDAQDFAKAVIVEERRLVALILPEEDRLEALQREWDAAKEREKQARIEAERRRVAAIRDRIDEIRQRPADAAGQSSAEIEHYIQALVALEIDGTFAEFKKEAEGAKETALIRLRSAHARALAHEDEQRQLAAERERLAREREEQERQQAAERARIAEEEQQARLAREAEEQRARAAREAEELRLAADRARQEAALQAERERFAEEQRHAAEAREAEEQRLAAERRQQQEEATRLQAQREQAEREEVERRASLAAEEQRITDERAQLEAERHALLTPPQVVSTPIYEGADIREDSVRQARDTPCDALSNSEADTAPQDRRIDPNAVREQVLVDVMAKRLRQISAHGWSPTHDDDHIEGELAQAAIPYIQAAYQQELGLSDEELPVYWPWPEDGVPNLKQSRRELLLNATALLVADIERLDREGAAA